MERSAAPDSEKQPSAPKCARASRCGRGGIRHLGEHAGADADVAGVLRVPGPGAEVKHMPVRRRRDDDARRPAQGGRRAIGEPGLSSAG